MSKINAVRLININYNNNAIRISDEIFHFNGESTLLSLRNGGGKSVLVQMMTAPFVHKRYRDAKDRPFESYFTTNKPSFILTEWVLDQGAGYVLTGMMVRRAPESEENSTENLEIVNFISEYQASCQQDIYHLPVVEKGKREIVLKNFTSCRQMFEIFKKEPGIKFFYYDMGNGAQSRQYFDKLMEYQINYKEWEGIIKKVNLKESGLSELFSDCHDEKGLVEKWFLDAVENKLNRDKNKIKEFQIILEKYVGLYKDNQSKIKRRDAIRLFQQEAVQIREKNQRCLECEIRVKEQENKIACFRSDLEELHQSTAQESQEILRRTEEIQEEISHLEYEKLSEEYYGLEEQKKFHASNREMIGMEKEDLEREEEKMTQKLHILACAKQQEVVNEERAEWEQACQRLAVARERKEDLQPERNCLGYLLRTYYQKSLEGTEAKLTANQEQFQKNTEQLQQERELLTELEESLRKNAQDIGELKSKMAEYDKQEERFCGRYQETFTQNILGEYEPGTLEIFGEVCRKSQEEAARKKSAAGREMEQAKNKKLSLEHSLADRKEEKTRTMAKMEQEQELRENYDRELSKRRAILKYLGLGEDALFQEEKIFHTTDLKLTEIERMRRNLEKEENELQKEYQRLTEGRVLELPPELEAELEAQGIHLVYGMEWLKKNGYSKEKNQKLTEQNPFLPYALILSEKEMKKLSLFEGGLPTAFPIPIILRQDLEQNIADKEGNLLRFPRLSFYLLFNENLLDEEKLQQLVDMKLLQIEKKQEMISIRKNEYGEYFAWKEQVKNQKVCQKNYQDNAEQIRTLEQKGKTLDQEMRSISQQLSENEEQMQSLEKEGRNAERQVEYLQRKEADFKELCAAFEDFQENHRRLEKCRQEEIHLDNQQKVCRLKAEKCQEQLQSLLNRQADLEREREQQQERLGIYQEYQQVPEQEILSILSMISGPKSEDRSDQKMEQTKDMPDQHTISSLLENSSELEARYAAVTATVSQELQELENQRQRSSRRHQQAKEELSHLAKKFRLAVKNWKDVNYSRREETDLEIHLEDRRMKIKLKESLWNQEDKQVALFNQQMQERMKRMAAECQKDTPLPKEEIRREDFESRKNQLLFQRKELQRDGELLQERLHNYDETLTALAEYSDFKVCKKVEWEEDFSAMDTQALRNFKGILLRDYNGWRSDRSKAREHLVQILNQIIRIESFQEEYYQKPLEAMLKLSRDAEQVQRQLDTTIQSYQSLIEKLEVDISVVEKEKNKIVELMEDYLSEVHQNLGRIDHNSTISIREHPVKMLKIQIPSWEENQGIYQLRLQEFVDELRKKGIEIFERNENAQEYFGTQMTTRNLYDTVIGIGNVQIRLYKIEEQREYPITWTEVAKNSGGEGFLSAFVVLSSLLHFMRRDESDIFADKNEGKVLLMDNPFAQTNAAHLLKPLMEMAKKTNTQLICLTGLGGESIYSRFDNIYVLNLIAASLRQGTQYLKAEHLRGNEPETMVVSQIEVVEQQELVF